MIEDKRKSHRARTQDSLTTRHLQPAVEQEALTLTTGHLQEMLAAESLTTAHLKQTLETAEEHKDEASQFTGRKEAHFINQDGGQMSDKKVIANDSLTTSHLQKSLTTAHYKQQVQNQQQGQSQGQTGQTGSGGSQSSSQEK